MGEQTASGQGGTRDRTLVRMAQPSSYNRLRVQTKGAAHSAQELCRLGRLRGAGIRDLSDAMQQSWHHARLGAPHCGGIRNGGTCGMAIHTTYAFLCTPRSQRSTWPTHSHRLFTSPHLSGKAYPTPSIHTAYMRTCLAKPTQHHPSTPHTCAPVWQSLSNTIHPHRIHAHLSGKAYPTPSIHTAYMRTSSRVAFPCGARWLLPY